MKAVPLKYLVALNSEVLPEITPPDREFDYIDISSVHRNLGVTRTEHTTFRDAPSRARRVVRAGDVIISTVRTYLRAVAAIPPSLDGQVCSTGFAVLRPVPGVDPRYLQYAVTNRRFVDEVVARSTGVSYPAITATELVRIAIPAPDRRQQRAIGRFLEQECSIMDELHRSVEGARAALDEELEGEFARMITDLEPQLVPVRRLVDAISDGPFGSALTSAHYVDSDGVRVVRLGNIGRASFEDQDRAFVSTEYARAELDDHFLRPGEVVVAGLGDANNPLGRAAVVPAAIGPAVHKADCYRLIPDPDRCVPEYLAIALSFGPARHHAQLLSRGSTRARLTTVVARDLPVPLLSPERQQDVAVAFERHRARTDLVREEYDRLEHTLFELRDALIAEAVNGLLDPSRDVRTSVGQFADDLEALAT